MAHNRPAPQSRNDFRIAIICALSTEADFVESVFDLFWKDHGKEYGKAPGDQNTYTTGRIGKHDVVLSYMPSMGSTNAAAVAAGLRSSFRGIEVAFVVGICGVIPRHLTTKEQIFLGDCVISTAVVQYDYGRQYPGGFVRKTETEDSLGRAPPGIRSFTAMLKTRRNRKRLTDQTSQLLKTLQQEYPEARYPGSHRDRLFESSYVHQHRPGVPPCDKCLNGVGICTKDCSELKCEDSHLVKRPRLQVGDGNDGSYNAETRLNIHFGLFGSANTVMKSGSDRDRLAEDGQLTAFEMEGSAVWDHFPTVVIKSACDYADSHKNKAFQTYAAATAAACLKAFLDEWVALEPANTDGSTRSVWKVNFSLVEVPEIEYFTARQEELIMIHSKLEKRDSRKIVILHGLGGIGKTQLAVSYARAHKKDYSAIFWLNIQDEGSVKQSFLRVAGQISRECGHVDGLTKAINDRDLDKVVDLVKSWLERPQNIAWLLIYDNYDNPRLPESRDPATVNIKEFLPQTDHGCVIITTRSSQVDIGHQIKVEKFKDIGDGLEILSLTSGRKVNMNDEDAIELAKRLDGLPLALATAGFYLREVTTSFRDYLRLYQECWLRLQQDSRPLSAYDHKLYSTWQLSYNHIQQENESSAKLLQLWAYFHYQDVWYELLQEPKSWREAPVWFLKLVANELSFNKAIRALSSHGLIDQNTSTIEVGGESKGYSMHGCVHAWTQHVLNEEFDVELARIALTILSDHIPHRDAPNAWEIQRRLLLHVEYISPLNASEVVDVTAGYLQMGRFAYLYAEQGRLVEAEQICCRILMQYEKALGSDHIEILTTFNNLGTLYADQGRLVEAEEMFERSLIGYEKVLGPDNLSQLDALNNLGDLHRRKGRLTEAEQMYSRALSTYEKVLGSDHITTLTIVNNLGNVYADQGRLVEAKQMYNRALMGYEKVLGPEHISTLNTINNLGNLYRAQGKLEAAEQIFKGALAGYEKTLGFEQIKTHHSGLNTIRNQAGLLEQLGRKGEARRKYIDLLEGLEIVFGRAHAQYEAVAEIVEELDE